MSQVLSAEQVQRYTQEGYLSPIDVFNEQDVGAFHQNLERFRHRLDLNGKIAGRYNQKPHLLLPWANQIVRHPRILDAVEQILGPNIFCWASQFFAKDPGDNAYVSWHQDGNYWGLSSVDVMTAWVALTPSTIESGCMNVVPGSQVRRVEHIDTYSDDNLLSRGQEIAVTVSPEEVRPIVLRPGQMSLHHVMIFHGSEPNRADHPRVGFAIRYVPTHVRQTAGDKDSAMLVRGVDTYHHFEHEREPDEEFSEAAMAQHRQVVERQLAILYAGAKKRKI
jgi:ectoine hydroxylase-related dioxygenase (phytanoyl-CoA dioxygenase family)